MKNRVNALYALYVTQFLSALADNMILFIIVEMLRQGGKGASYLGIVQASFIFAYVILAAFVGPFADKNYKSNVLLIGNLIKCLGVFMFIFNINPVLSYFVVGIGAVIYSPAKYGLLPELSKSDKQLHNANAQMEAYTIISILIGTIAGGFAATKSLSLGLTIVTVLYFLSILVAFFIPKTVANQNIEYKKSISDFFKDFKLLFSIPKTRFSLVGTASFWMNSSVLRIAVIAWIPFALGITSTDKQSMIFAAVGLGIIIGSLVTPLLVSVKKYYNAYIYGGLMVVAMLILPFTTNLYFAVFLLFAIGFLSGAYVVPMNTAVQQVGHKRIGSGKTIAVQNFGNNLLMLIGTLIYTFVSSKDVSPNTLIWGLGIVLGLFILYLFSQIPKVKKES